VAAARGAEGGGGRARRKAVAPAGPPQHLLKRSFRLAGHRTSVALEAEFWRALEAAAERRGQALAALVEELDAGRAETARPLASTLRVFALGEPRA
jgi:predicted DNA-binding ribbon-helix-helix protein